jgi:hypothetical protein
MPSAEATLQTRQCIENAIYDRARRAPQDVYDASGDLLEPS